MNYTVKMRFSLTMVVKVKNCNSHSPLQLTHSAMLLLSIISRDVYTGKRHFTIYLIRSYPGISYHQILSRHTLSSYLIQAYIIIRSYPGISYHIQAYLITSRHIIISYPGRRRGRVGLHRPRFPPCHC